MASIPSKIIKFLEKSGIQYEAIKHRTVYTAYDKAATLRIKPNIVGKTLVLKTDSDMAVVLIPGNKNLDKVKFQKVLNI
jgi:Ala-tRNA(Pro) deacylase